MTQPPRCPKCGAALPAQAPAGVCPKCLLQAGMPYEDPQVTTTGRAKPFGLPDTAALAAHFPDLEFGTLLGQGGMGAVYRVRQTRLDRFAALKIIRPDSAGDRSFAERFNREARTLARLNHPNIVSVYDFGDLTLTGDDGRPQLIYYFLMEYVGGANLRQLMRAGELNASRSLSVVSQICDALQFAHNEGIVHRDIKPENILVDPTGRVKIADFGLAKLLSDDVTDHTLTGPQQVMGTPRYMAPEQMQGAGSVDHRADIYSLGVVFYEMLTGELPFGRFDPPSQRAAFGLPVHEQWDQVVMRALEQQPNRRYQNASDIKTDMENASRPDGVAAAAMAPEAPASSADPNALGAIDLPNASDESATTTDGTVPHYGFLIQGAAMTGLGISFLAIALTNNVNMVFVWIGLGLAIGGTGPILMAFTKDARLPAGTSPNYGLLFQGGTMGFVGLVLLLSRFVVSRSFESLHPSNVFIWIGMGLMLGGASVAITAWGSVREESDDDEQAKA